MPALLILAVISWLFGSGKSRPKTDETFIFTALAVRPRRNWGTFLVSIAVHAICITLVLGLPDLFTSSDDVLFARQLATHALVINMPDRIYLPPPRRRTSNAREPLKNAALVAVPRKDLRKYSEEAAEAKLMAPPELPPVVGQPGFLSIVTPAPVAPPKAEPRKFVLPDLPVRNHATQTILQADLPPDLPPQVNQRLPQLVFWDAEKAKLPDKPINPGNLTAKLQTPKLNSTPRLEAPNRETLASDISVASAPSSTLRALLSPATTMPLQLLDSAKDPTGPSSIDPLTGQPVHVLAISADPAPPTGALKELLIPAGNQLARLPGTSPLFGIPGMGDSSGGSGATGSSGNAAGVGEGGPANGGKGTARAGGSAHSFPGDGRLSGILSPPGLNGTPLRVIHPSNGVFDIVVVQSSSAETFPDGADALSGRPIYTVYLQVGAAKEWILQYCLPNMAGTLQTGSIVKLGNTESVASPYPVVTVRPPEDWQHGPDYLLVHGFLDESGRFREMKILPGRAATASTTTALLQYLSFWEFRPALQDGRPVKVEVILAVPPDRVSLSQITR
jgi:hypothetical protein